VNLLAAFFDRRGHLGQVLGGEDSGERQDTLPPWLYALAICERPGKLYHLALLGRCQTLKFAKELMLQVWIDQQSPPTMEQSVGQ
jgi:hypothetical protein